MNEELDPRDEQAPPEHGRAYRTKRRLVIAVILLAVAAIAVEVATNAVKTHRELRTAYLGVTKIDARIEDGTLKLVPTNGLSVDVDRKENYTLRGPAITEEVRNGTLIIRQKCSGLHVGECTASYVVSVPSTVMTTAVTTGGAVNVNGLRGPLNLTTAGGKVTASQTFGELAITTQTGKIACDDLASTTATATSKSGQITLAFSVEPMKVDARSNDGEVSIIVPKTNATYNVDAVSANKGSTVGVRVDTTSPRQITAHSENGAVSVDRS